MHGGSVVRRRRRFCSPAWFSRERRGNTFEEALLSMNRCRLSLPLLSCVVVTAVLSGCQARSAAPASPGTPESPRAAAVAPRSAPEQNSLNRGARAAAPASAAAPRPSGPITFVDAASPAGIHFRHNNGAFGKKYLPETMGSGVCVIDYDNDGWPDLFFVNSTDWADHKQHHTLPALYHNNHDGTFTDVTKQAGLAVEMYGLGCAVGDFDNDGHDDLYVTAIGGSHLFRNLGNGRFADVTARAG